MTLGFTGTRWGCTAAQRARLRAYLLSLGVDEFHHGQCIGADEDAHIIMVGHARVICHPGNKADKTAECPGADLYLPPKPPLDRNKIIVRSTRGLVACPNGMEEELRSGTWMTVRFARRIKRPITYVWPDGTLTTE